MHLLGKTTEKRVPTKWRLRMEQKALFDEAGIEQTMSDYEEEFGLHYESGTIQNWKGSWRTKVVANNCSLCVFDVARILPLKFDFRTQIFSYSRMIYPKVCLNCFQIQMFMQVCVSSP